MEDPLDVDKKKKKQRLKKEAQPFSSILETENEADHTSIEENKVLSNPDTTIESQINHVSSHIKSVQ